MQLGFLCLESGLTRSKNSISVAFNNVMDFALCSLLFYFAAYMMIFGPSFHGFVGLQLLDPQSLVHFWNSDASLTPHFFFNLAFYCTSATIISGAIAERVRLRTYLMMVFVTSLLIYPFVAHWVWKSADGISSSGWLKSQGFVDFAGGTVVHSVAGWISLAAILVIGPRSGRFDRSNVLSSSNLPLTMLGVLLLVIGWLGFNAGALGRLDQSTAPIMVKTLLSGSAGMVATYLWVLQSSKKVASIEELSTGLLTGLVAITPGCSAVVPGSAILIGAVAGLLSKMAISLLYRLKIDDAVHAIPAHLVGGVWGTLAVGFFGNSELLGTGLSTSSQLAVQVEGVAATGIWSFGLSYLLFRIINRFKPLRISLEDEMQGLNYSEHGATTELTDLLTDMKKHSDQQEFQTPAHEEPYTTVGQIARYYNKVLKAFVNAQNKEHILRQEAEERATELAKTQEALKQINDNLEREVQLRTTKLLQSEKLAFIGTHSAEIIHNLQNPLSGILLCASKMEREDANNKYVKIITTAGKQLKQIISSLLVSARASITPPAQINLNEIIQSEIDLLKIRLVKTKQVEIKADLKEIPLIEGVAIHFHQVISNLIENAVDSMGETLDKVLSISTVFEGGRVQILVCDTGHGISETIREQIFEPFFTTKYDSSSLMKGTGLGLSFSYNVIKSYGGDLSLVPKTTPGTCFQILLPIQSQS